ncbi:MAG: VWA domain-containing protein [Gammaproteobacteria bacterium]|nr:VWA domain-containing protein [Gammaproteobacteria bacterium]
MEFFAGLHFLRPGWLWALLPSLLVLGLLVRANRLRALAWLPVLHATQVFRHPRIGLLRRIEAGGLRGGPRRDAYRRWAGYALLLLCLHLALAHPYRLGKQLPQPPEYRDAVFVIDTSVNMLLRDYLVAGERVDRMTILKSVLTHFIGKLEGNRIGLIVFSETPYTLVPLTADYDLLKSMVRRLEPAVLTGRSTDLGKALLYTLQQLQQNEAPQKPVIVLITDVNRSYRDVDPRSVAAYLHEQGFRLQTVGIGASSYAAQETDSRGLLYQPANFGFLQAIAERGGGRFYRADSAGSLQGAIAAIQTAERRKLQQAPRHVAIPLYQWPLLAGLLWIALVQLPAGRRQRR